MENKTMAITQQKQTEITNWVSSNNFEPVMEQIIEYGSKTNDNTEETVYTFIENGLLTAPFSYSVSMIDYIAQTILYKHREIIRKRIAENRRLNKITTDF